MATRFKSVITLLAAAMVVATAACASDPPVPTPNIDATIESGIAATMVVVEIEKGVAATKAAPIDHNNRAETYSNLGEYENAIQEYNKAIQLDPTMPLPTTTVVLSSPTWVKASVPSRTTTKPSS